MTEADDRIIDCTNLPAYLREFSLVKECTALPDGTIRIATPFRYPDGSFVDLFLTPPAKDELFPAFTLSDFGQTATFLLSLRLDMHATKKRREAVADVCRALEVDEQGGQFQVRLELGAMSQLSDAMVRLGLACVRVADLSFTQRFPATSTFKDNVEEFLAQQEGVTYEPDVRLPGRFGVDVPVDFRVRGGRVTSLLKALSTANPATAHTLMNEALRCWYDLALHSEHSHFITVVDDRADVYRDDDLRRLESMSTLLGFPSQAEQLHTLLVA